MSVYLAFGITHKLRNMYENIYVNQQQIFTQERKGKGKKNPHQCGCPYPCIICKLTNTLTFIL